MAGAASVGVLWATVRRWFGVGAATVAGLVLAFTPISASVNRLNLPEPFMILLLVAAAWAVLRALDSPQPYRWLVLGGAFVGLGFNTKMLAALIVTPALALAVVAGTKGWGLRVRRVLVLAGSSLAFCLPWMVTVDLWPSSGRPYVGGSTNNTVRDLVFGYNGIGRVDGQGQIGGGGARFPAGIRGPGGANGVGGPGGVFGGPAGWLRMFSDAVGGQIAWLLPAAAVGAALALWCWRRDRQRRAAVVLFAGWVLLYGVIFSNAKGIFHSYYTSVMAPAIAALVGIGGLAVLRSRHRWVALVAAGGVALTAWVQWTVANRTPDFFSWTRAVLVLLCVAAVVGLVVLAVRPGPARAARAVLLTALAGLLVVPAAWSFSEAANPTLNATLPQAGPRGGAAGGTFGSAAFGGPAVSEDDQLATWLRSQRGNERWDLVTVSAMQASGLEADQGLSVMALGGFLGSDPATTPGRFAAQVDAGQVRFVLAGGGFPGGGRFPGGGGAFPGGGFPGAGGGVPGAGAGFPGAGGGVPGAGGGVPGAGGRPRCGRVPRRRRAALLAAGSEADRAAPVEGTRRRSSRGPSRSARPSRRPRPPASRRPTTARSTTAPARARPWRPAPADGQAGRRLALAASRGQSRWRAGACASCVRGDRAHRGPPSSSRPRLYRCARAPPPATRCSTSASVAIEVSPGVVIARAPWAAPYSTATSTGSPRSRP